MFHDESAITKTDSYKLTHGPMWPQGTKYVYSYFESREQSAYPETVVFGLQYILDQHFTGKQVRREDLEEAQQFCIKHFGQDLFNRTGWESILKHHGGRLPLSIKAVPEGMVVPESNIMLSITNTCDPDDHDPALCSFVVNAMETLLVQLWYPCTVATVSRNNKKTLLAALEESGDPDKLPVMLHDFGYRGSTCYEAAGIGGAAHLVNFIGTDNIAGVRMLQKHYDADMPGVSVPAAEHSTITSWGPDGEVDAFRNALRQYPRGYVSIVSDSWNIYDACVAWGNELREEILENKERTVVIRPDSGEPEKVLPEILNLLGANFQYHFNEKGYRVLPDQVRLIQGDGITRHSLPGILRAVMDEKWSIDNLVFGSGGGLLQDFTRDLQRFALKCSAVYVGDQWRDVYKDPASDPTKASKKGRLKLVRDPIQGLMTVAHDHPGNDNLVEVFRDGVILRRWTLEEVRNRAKLPA